MKVMFWKLSLLISSVLFALSGQAQKHFEASYELTTNLPKNFIAAEQERLYELQAKYIAIERTFGTFIESNSTLSIVDDGKYISEVQFKANAESKVAGTWVKDITPPEITYTNKGKEKWITVKVHGYVAKRPNKTEARELLLKQLSTKPLMEDVQVHLIEYYPNDFIVSAVVLDKRIHTNEANINTEARMIAESNLQEAVIIGNYRKAYGWVPSVEFLTTLKGTTDHHVVYIFIKEVEEE